MDQNLPFYEVSCRRGLRRRLRAAEVYTEALRYCDRGISGGGHRHVHEYYCGGYGGDSPCSGGSVGHRVVHCLDKARAHSC